MKPEVKKIFKENSTLSLVKIVATVLTAISMSLIVSKITTMTNTVMLAGIVSLGTVITNEIYRIVVETTALGAKKVIVAPLVSKIGDRIITEDGEEIVPVQKLNETEELAIVSKKVPGGFREHIARIPQIIKMSIIFALVSMVTIAISYFISSSVEKNEYVSNYTTVQTEKQSISKKEKDEIISSAVSTAKSQLNKDEEIASLQAENEQLNELLDRAQKQIDELEKRLSEIENRTKNETTTPSPSPTPSSISPLG